MHRGPSRDRFEHGHDAGQVHDTRHREHLRVEGYARPVVALLVRSIGRLPVTITATGASSTPGASLSTPVAAWWRRQTDRFGRRLAGDSTRSS